MKHRTKSDLYLQKEVIYFLLSFRALARSLIKYVLFIVSSLTFSSSFNICQHPCSIFLSRNQFRSFFLFCTICNNDTLAAHVGYVILFHIIPARSRFLYMIHLNLGKHPAEEASSNLFGHGITRKSAPRPAAPPPTGGPRVCDLTLRHSAGEHPSECPTQLPPLTCKSSEEAPGYFPRSRFESCLNKMHVRGRMPCAYTYIYLICANEIVLESRNLIA